MIRIYMYRLSQRVLLTSLASNRTTLQLNYSESLTDYKFKLNGIARDSIRDDETNLYACERLTADVAVCDLPPQNPTVKTTALSSATCW